MLIIFFKYLCLYVLFCLPITTNCIHLCFLQDFVTEFGTLEMTNLSPDSLTDEDVMDSVQHKWEMSVYEGAWIRGSTAGGCRNYLRQ